MTAADGGDADGGDTDSGPPADSGVEGEGEGEGEPWTCSACDLEYQCVARNERIDDLVDDAGVLHYENCWNAYYFENDCTLGECVTNDAQRDALEAAHAIAASRGYRIEIADIRGDQVQERVSLQGAVVVDWARAFFFTRVSLTDAGTVDVEQLGDRLPVSVPAALPPFPDLLAALRSCDPSLEPDICLLSPSEAALTGFPVGVCGGAGIRLWSNFEPDAGVSEVSCSPSDLPCCYREDE